MMSKHIPLRREEFGDDWFVLKTIHFGLFLNKKSPFVWRGALV